MTSTQIIAKEGYKGIAIICILVIVFLLFGWNILIFLSFLCLILWIFAFRNPERISKDKQNRVLLAPVDGEVVKIEYQDNMVEILFKIDWFDVGLIRAPINLEGFQISSKKGLFLHNSSQQIKEALNTKIELFSPERNFKLEIFPEIFSKARFYESNSVLIGERIGFIKLGYVKMSLESIFLDIKVNVGDKIKGGETSIGYIK